MKVAAGSAQHDRQGALWSLAWRLSVVIIVPPGAAGLLDWFVGGSDMLAASAVGVVSLATAFGVFCVASARVGLRGAGSLVVWSGWVYTWFGWLGLTAACVIVFVASGDMWWIVVCAALLVVGVGFAVSNWPGNGDANRLTSFSTLLLAVRIRSLPATIDREQERIAHLEALVNAAAAVPRDAAPTPPAPQPASGTSPNVPVV